MHILASLIIIILKNWAITRLAKLMNSDCIVYTITGRESFSCETLFCTKDVQDPTPLRVFENT